MYLLIELVSEKPYFQRALGRSLALAVPKLLTALLYFSCDPFNKRSGLKKAVGE